MLQLGYRTLHFLPERFLQFLVHYKILFKSKRILGEGGQNVKTSSYKIYKCWSDGFEVFSSPLKLICVNNSICSFGPKQVLIELRIFSDIVMTIFFYLHLLIYVNKIS